MPSLSPEFRPDVLKRRTLLAASLTAAGLAVAGCATKPKEPRVLFIGNSFTFGEGSDAKYFGAASVRDLNGTGHGGMPALFKAMAAQLGVSYDVSLEAMPDAGLDRHFRERLDVIIRPWDIVVMHGISTLDERKPGDPALLVAYARRISTLLLQQNPKVDIRLMATWARADETYLPTGAWRGKPIRAMYRDVRAGYDLAAASGTGVRSVIPVGAAWNLAFESGIADPNPYDGVQPPFIDLWAADHYHASKYGTYLEALVVMGSLTGLDPRALGRSDSVAAKLGIGPEDANALQTVAWKTLSGVQ